MNEDEMEATERAISDESMAMIRSSTRDPRELANGLRDMARIKRGEEMEGQAELHDLAAAAIERLHAEVVYQKGLIHAQHEVVCTEVMHENHRLQGQIQRVEAAIESQWEPLADGSEGVSVHRLKVALDGR